MSIRNVLKTVGGMVCAIAPSLASAGHQHHTIQFAAEMPSGIFFQMKADEMAGNGSGEGGKILPKDTLFFMPRESLDNKSYIAYQQNVTGAEVDSTGRFKWAEINGECKLSIAMGQNPALTLKDGNVITGSFGHRDALGKEISLMTLGPVPATPAVDSCTYQGKKVSLRPSNLIHG